MTTVIVSPALPTLHLYTAFHHGNTVTLFVVFELLRRMSACDI